MSRDAGATWKKAIHRYTSSVVFTLSYGRRIDSLDSTTHQTRIGFLLYSNTLTKPGKYLVESLPFLRTLPDWMASWRIEIQEMGDKLAAFDNRLVEVVKSDLAKSGGQELGSITENILEAASNGDDDIQTLMRNPDHFSGIPGLLFGAGSQITISSLSATVLGFLTKPHVFLAAQNEMDTVVGSQRSPRFADREKLPYIDAIIKESLRWRPVAPFGVSHATTESDSYKGYTIPAGTGVIYNTWGMHHDPSYFPFPEDFGPERFLDEKDPRCKPEIRGEKTFPGKYGHSGFGWGRRICVGADSGMNGMWIVIAKLVFGFCLEGVEGFEYDKVGIVGDIIVEVGEFPCRWRVRDGFYKEVLEREMVGAEEVLDKFKPLE